MTRKFLLTLLLAGTSLTACAQGDAPAAAKPAQPAAAAAKPASEPGSPPGTPEAAAREVVRLLNPDAKVERIGPAPLPGFREAVVGGQVLYISDDGKYLMQGVLLDIANKKNLSEAAMAKVRRELLQKVPDADRIVFSPPNPKHTVVVFTDVECGYCRKLHSDIAEYNRQGIAVEYLAFPRMGVNTPDFEKMVAVWCAKDRRKAMTDAKSDRRVPTRNCANPVRQQYDIGQRVGLTGTPMILAEDGTQISGYLPPAELRAAMDRHAAGATGTGAGGR
jgi:thiol:disulfide interchange protein DsbC